MKVDAATIAEARRQQAEAELPARAEMATRIHDLTVRLAQLEDFCRALQMRVASLEVHLPREGVVSGTRAGDTAPTISAG